MKKNLWKLVLVSSFCAVGLGLNNGEKVSATENPTMLETGAEIKIPLFVEEGEKIRIDTRTGEYIERA